MSDNLRIVKFMGYGGKWQYQPQAYITKRTWFGFGPERSEWVDIGYNHGMPRMVKEDVQRYVDNFMFTDVIG